MFSKAKKLILTLLAVILFITSTITMFPAPASALGDLHMENNVNFSCESDCGSFVSFAAGVASGSAVTLMATGQGATVAGIGSIGGAIAHGIVSAAGAAATGGAVVAATPVLVPVAVGAAAIGGGYIVYQQIAHSSDHK